eukprot:237962_1
MHVKHASFATGSIAPLATHFPVPITGDHQVFPVVLHFHHIIYSNICIRTMWDNHYPIITKQPLIVANHELTKHQPDGDPTQHNTSIRILRKIHCIQGIQHSS